MTETIQDIAVDYNALKPTGFKGIHQSEYDAIEARAIAAGGTMFELRKLARTLRVQALPDAPADPPKPTVVGTRTDTETRVVELSGEPTGQERETEDLNDEGDLIIERELEDAKVTYETYRTYEVYSDGSEELIKTVGPKEVSRTDVDLYWV